MLFTKIIIVITAFSEMIFLKQCYHYISVDGLIIIIKFPLGAFSKRVLSFYFTFYR